MFMEIGIRTLVFVNLFEKESQAINIKFYLLLPSKPGAKATNKEEILSQSESFYCPLDHVFLFFLPLYILIWQIMLYLVILAEDAQLTPVLRLGAGACAGIIAMSATYPMDMVRGRITVQVLFLLLLK